MIRIENINTFGWEAAIRGMRNPLNSWEKSDSRVYTRATDLHDEEWFIGPNDEKLMKSLIRGGPVECKFRRMIHAQMDITAPLYWWKEFDTYKVGTVANSCSTMHKIHAKEFTFEDFSTEHLISGNDPNTPMAITLTTDSDNEVQNSPWDVFDLVIASLNSCREWYLETKDKKYWWQMIQLLPSSYNQKRTVDLSYEVLANIYKHRKNHKLDEWQTLCGYLATYLPYSWIFTEEWDWEDVPKKKPAVKTKTEEKNKKPTSGRFPWGNDAPDAMVYAVQYAEELKKSKGRKSDVKPDPKEDDKQAAFELAIIEAVGALRDRGFSNQGIYTTLLEMFGEV